MQNILNLKDIIANNDSISQSSQQSNNSLFPNDIVSLPKKQINAFAFLLNILWMLFSCYAIIYYVYSDKYHMNEKAYLAAAALGFTCLVSIPTFYYLVSFKQLIRLTILFDTIMVMTIAAVIAFINLILIMETTYQWYWTMIEVGFAIELIFYSSMTRIFLVQLSWKKWQLITFKLSVMANCIMFLINGVYFIYVDFSYTMHFLPAFDNKVHDFMLLFIFSLFTYTLEMYSKITDLDRTGELRYVYSIKNVDKTLPLKKQSIIKKKRQSMVSFNLLMRNQEQIQNKENTIKKSRFAQIESMT